MILNCFETTAYSIIILSSNFFIRVMIMDTPFFCVILGSDFQNSTSGYPYEKSSHLRVIQKNLLFVNGLPSSLGDQEVISSLRKGSQIQKILWEIWKSQQNHSESAEGE